VGGEALSGSNIGCGLKGQEGEKTRICREMFIRRRERTNVAPRLEGVGQPFERKVGRKGSLHLQKRGGGVKRGRGNNLSMKGRMATGIDRVSTQSALKFGKTRRGGRWHFHGRIHAVFLAGWKRKKKRKERGGFRGISPNTERSPSLSSRFCKGKKERGKEWSCFPSISG